MFYFGTNLKMHGTAAETLAFVQTLEQGLSRYARDSLDVQGFVLPPFTSLPGLVGHTRKLWVGAQTMHWAEEGPYTGEISPVMLAALGVRLVMLGHAERRHGFGETDEVIQKKVRAAFRREFRVLLCVGETDAQRQRGEGLVVVTKQLESALQGIDREDWDRLLIAYEPVWAIGAGGREAEPGEIRKSLQAIRRTLETLQRGNGVLEHVPILYGGSVTRENCAAYASLGIDGLFVGRAAWQAGEFLDVLERSLAVYKATATARKSAAL